MDFEVAVQLALPFATLILISCNNFPSTLNRTLKWKSHIAQAFLLFILRAEQNINEKFFSAHLRLLKIPSRTMNTLRPPVRFAHLPSVLLHLSARNLQEQPLAQHIQRIDNGQRRFIPLGQRVLILKIENERETERSNFLCIHFLTSAYSAQ